MEIDRSKSRWTLGGLMVLIAALAVPLAWYVHRAREVALQVAAAEAQVAAAVLRVEASLLAKDEEILREADASIARPRSSPKSGPERSSNAGATPPDAAPEPRR